MVNDKIEFDYGDIVTVKLTAPENYKPGLKGCICGIRAIDSDQAAVHFNQPLTSELYLIEFSDGTSIEIPKIFLTK